jgi:hypothetical protein
MDTTEAAVLINFGNREITDAVFRNIAVRNHPVAIKKGDARAVQHGKRFKRMRRIIIV